MALSSAHTDGEHFRLQLISNSHSAVEDHYDSTIRQFQYAPFFSLFAIFNGDVATLGVPYGTI